MSEELMEFVRRPSMSQLSLNLMHGIRIFVVASPWAIRGGVLNIFWKKK